MKILSSTQICQRINNEDSLGHQHNLFVVCDGVGGHKKGEIASRFVVEECLKWSSLQSEFSKKSIKNALVNTQEKLNQLVSHSQEFENMATTFCGLYKSETAYFVSHIGDSRCYFIRPSKHQFWHTYDHTIAGDLYRNQQITEQEANSHPKGNQLYRAFIAGQEKNKLKPEITKITEVKEGDLFFICSDGVQEAFSNQQLISCLTSKKTLEEKRKFIASQCHLHSKDNSTFYLLEVEQKDTCTTGENEEIFWQSNNTQIKSSNIEQSFEINEETDIVWGKFVRLFLPIGLAGIILYLLTQIFL